jgi:dihydroneopterin aldolase/2-amino-4-hydroxy-6-hydroxymethyldihydropteridine diphosphokinase
MNGRIELELKNIQAHTIIGCNADERVNVQELIIDLTLGLGEWSAPDGLDSTVDYSALSQLVKELAENSQFLLLESLAQHIVQELFARYALIEEVAIKLSKPQIIPLLDCEIYVNYHQLREYPVAIALGSNLHNPRQQLISAIEFLSETIGEIKVAPIYKTSPAGFSEQDDFFNTCITGVTTLKPQQLLVALKKIEKQMGKVEQFTNGPRIIDLDIIFFGTQVVEQLFLKIPHPRMVERDFVLRPLADIADSWHHPVLGLTVSELLAGLKADHHYILQRVD